MNGLTRRTALVAVPVLATISALAATPLVAVGASSSDGVGDEIPPEYFTLLPDDHDLIDKLIRGFARLEEKEAKGNGPHAVT